MDSASAVLQIREGQRPTECARAGSFFSPAAVATASRPRGAGDWAAAVLFVLCRDPSLRAAGREINNRGDAAMNNG